MGETVAGVPGGDRVGRPSTDRIPFGRWFGQERRLRRVSIDYVSIATRMDPARICALEAESELLPADGRGRAMARALARCIGADPDEAAARLRSAPSWDEETVEAPRRELVAALALGILGLGLILGASRFTAGWTAAEEITLVHRPDHVGALLTDEAPPVGLTGNSN